MSFETFPGETVDQSQDRNKWRWALVAAGCLKYVIPLNGGSDERRTILEAVESQLAGNNMLYVQASSYEIAIRSALHRP